MTALLFVMDWSLHTWQWNVRAEKLFISHAPQCAKGSYIHIRHDAIRDTFVNIMDAVYYDVDIEPPLQPLQGEFFGFQNNDH